MSEIFLIFGFIIVLAIGAFLGFFISGLKSKGEKSTLTERNTQLSLQFETYKNDIQRQLSELKEQSLEQKNAVEKQLLDACGERENIRKEKDFLRDQLTKRETEFENLRQKNEEQKAEVEKLQEKFHKEFEILASKILDQKSEKFTTLNKENIQNILTPLQERIANFEKRVEDTHKDSIGRNSQLQEQIRGLKELNEQMSKEATNLTKALKGDNKMQGNWGELVLERVLEKSGLEKDREYFVQNSFTTEEGKRVLPDVVINLPDNKKMIIDSKVSLNAYERFVNEEDADERAVYLKEHINSLKRHIDQLSAKNYHQLYDIESPDFVLLFVPIEPAFAVA
ncbi:MAG TPA: DNA recombination protein RmuC, partial [Salinimicrobium sp.]|nr:DNA recombination protein RmuC [Salinimicrobium sp.]